jgi:hypothetical protein
MFNGSQRCPGVSLVTYWVFIGRWRSGGLISGKLIGRLWAVGLVLWISNGL